MSGFGNKLMLKRLAMSLSIKDAARKSGLKQKQIKALEDEDILRFKEKSQADEVLKTYAAALGLDQTEIANDFNLAWSDSSTAKAYMQKQYKKDKFNIFAGNQALKYGLLLAGLVVLVGAGGYYYWSGLDNEQHPAGTALPGPTEINSIETSSPDSETPADMGIENDVAGQLPSDGVNVDEDHSAIEAFAEAEEEDISPEIESDDDILSAADNQDIVLPRSAGNLYLAWIGVLTLVTGLILIALTYLLNGRDLTGGFNGWDAVNS